MLWTSEAHQKQETGPWSGCQATTSISCWCHGNNTGHMQPLLEFIMWRWRENKIGRKKRSESLMIHSRVFLNNLRRAGTKARYHPICFFCATGAQFIFHVAKSGNIDLTCSHHVTLLLLLLAFEYSNIWLLLLFPVSNIVKWMWTPSHNHCTHSHWPSHWI